MSRRGWSSRWPDAASVPRQPDTEQAREADEQDTAVDAAAQIESTFFTALDDDLDTPGALLVLDAAAVAVTAAAARGQDSDGGVDGGVLLIRLAGLLGVGLAGN